MAETATKFAVAKDVEPSDPDAIHNFEFMQQLGKLRRLRSFVVREKITPKGERPAKVDLGALNTIVFAENGRQPSDAEWDDVNKKLQYFYGLLSETERRRFNFTLAAPMLKVMPTALVIVSILSLIPPILYPANYAISFIAFLVWIVVLGALGSIAFILVNVLGIQVDPTVDVSDRDSTMFRVLLGALFSVVLTLPFGYPSFQHFDAYILSPKDTAALDAKEALLLLAPFLFGFSTSLVLTVLNRLVEGVQTFFGVSGKKS